MKELRYLLPLCVFMVLTTGNLKSQPGCPSVDAGPNQSLNCNTTCTNLTATMLETGATTSYTVSSVPYNPPYPYTTGTPILVNQDDVWSTAITLPFTFCIYGNAYTQIVAGSNGCISFGPANSGAYCAWSYSVSCPNPNIISGSTGPFVLGPYHDIDPSVSGTMKYAILGTYPCRTFVVNWNQVAMYSSSCNYMKATQQIVLYESTNVIEVYIQNKPLCSSWNSGNATIGIQNATGTQGICPPGRNTGQWTASNEAWRFTPSGTPNFTLEWYQGYTLIGSTPIINVCPPTTTTYTAQITYNCCTGLQVILTDDVIVTVNNSIGLAIDPTADTICAGESTTLTATSTNSSATYQWSTGTLGPTITVTPTSTTTYIVTAISPGCTTLDSAVVTVNANPVISVTNASVCNGQMATLVASGASSYVWNNGGSSDTLLVTPSVTTTYTVTGTTLGCTATGNGVVTVNPVPTVSMTNTNETCGLTNGTATAVVGGGCAQYTYEWSSAPVQTTQTAINLPAGSYTVTVTCNGGCTGTSSTVITNISGPTVSITNTANSTCGYSNGSSTASVSGGTPPYTYAWDCAIPYVTTPTMSNVPAGTYHVSVTDYNGCLATNAVTITTTVPPVSSILVIQNADCNQPNGGATLDINSGTPPYTFRWNSNPIQTTQDLASVPSGNYSVTVTDTSGCTSISTVFVPENPGPTATTTFSDEMCNKADGWAKVTASGGGTGFFTYLWSNGDTTATISNLMHGTYSVTVSDGFCTFITNVTISNIPGPTAGFSSHPDIVSGTDTPVSFLNTSSGNIVNCFWDFGDGSTGSGNYIQHLYTLIGSFVATLIVTDDNGCVDTISHTIKVKDIFTIYIPSAFSPNGDGKNDMWYTFGNNIDGNDYDCKIFDRWGKLMFHTNNWYGTYAEPWNGTRNNNGSKDQIVMGTYVYRIIAKEIDGPRHEYLGRITIVP